MQTSSLDVASILAKSNFDWICIDLEHGHISIEKLKGLITIFSSNNKTVFVRLRSKQPEDLPNILDTGVDGILVPHVENADDLKKIILKTFYPPTGNRGFGFSAANDYGKNILPYVKKSKNIKIIAMIENKFAVQNLNQILKLNEIHGVFIGPYDLSASYGILEKFDSKVFKNLIKKIKNEVKKSKKLCGIHIVNNDRKKLESAKKEGFNFIAFSMDTVILNNYKI